MWCVCVLGVCWVVGVGGEDVVLGGVCVWCMCWAGGGGRCMWRVCVGRVVGVGRGHVLGERPPITMNVLSGWVRRYLS